MFARCHCDRCPWMSPYLRSVRASTVRTAQSRSSGVRFKLPDESASPSHRKIERSLMVSRRDRLGLHDVADRLDSVGPSLPLPAITCNCVEIRENFMRLVRHFRRWLPTHVVTLVDRCGCGEGVPCCPPRFLGPGVAAQTGLSSTQPSVVNAARLGGWRRLFEPAVPSRIHIRRLRRQAPGRPRVTGDYPSGVPAQVRPSRLLKPCGVTPWH